MNIFVLSEDPVEAAQMHCDKHCVKMVVELYQQLGSALRRHGATDNQMPATQSNKPLRGGYHNHPCTRWCGDSRENFEWAAKHAIALADEYTYRYGKVHSCESGIRQMASMSYLIPSDRLTPFAQAMPDQYKNPCAVTAYHDYYWLDKRINIKCEWNKARPKPQWWISLETLTELTQEAQSLGLY
jgi:hypothetical protein